MTRTLASLGGLLCMALLLAACSSSSSSTTSAAAPKLTKSPFHIEYIGDLTGSEAAQNVPEAAGIKAWATVVNDTGGVDGHPVDITICDAQSSLTGALSCASAVPADVGIVAFDGDAGQVKAAPPVLKTEGKVMLTDDPTANPPQGSNLFQVSGPISDTIAADLKLAKENHISSIGVVTTSNATGVAVSKIFNALSKSFGITVDIEDLAPSSVDATIQVTQLKQDHVQMLYIGTLGEPAIASLEAAHELGWSTPIFVLPADVTATYLTDFKPYMPTQLYGQPPDGFQLPAVLTGVAKTDFEHLESKYKTITGKTWDTSVDGPIGAFFGALGATVLSHVGAQPTIQQVSQYLHNGTITTSLGPISFPTSTTFQDGSLPAPLAEATRSPLRWEPCVSSSLLKC